MAGVAELRLWLTEHWSGASGEFLLLHRAVLAGVWRVVAGAIIDRSVISGFGRDAKVGAGSVVLHDVPPRATVAGVPAKIVGWSSGSVPALEMDQSLPDYEI